MQARTGRSLGLAAILAAGAIAAGCGNSHDGGGAGGAASGTSAHYKLTLITGVKSDEFYITMGCGAQQQADKMGAQLNIQGPDKFDAGLQTPIVNAVAASKPDAVLIAPTDSKAMYAPIKQLQAAGAKIALVDTTLDHANLAISQISSNNTEGGRAAAHALAKLIGGKGKVLLVNVKPGISTTDQRAQGFEEVVKGSPGLQYVGVQYSNDDPAQAASAVKAVLSRHPDLKGVFAANVLTAEGVASGIREAGKTNQVKVVSFDAGPKQVEDLKQGTVQALIAQQPAQIGSDGVKQAVLALQGKPTEQKITTGFNTITKQGLDTPAAQRAIYKSSC